LAARGYATAAIVANTDYASREVGLGRGFLHFEDYDLTPGLMLRSAALGRAIGRSPVVRAFVGTEQALGRKDAPEISRAFSDWIAGQGTRPWFAMLNYYDAHRPYQPPEPYYSMFATPEVPPDPRFRQDDDPDDPWTPNDAARFIAAYDGAIAYLDAEIDALLSDLERRGQLDKTLVIITSDHGEEFGEHRLYDHGHSLYLASVHVPLVVLAPGWAPRGAVVRSPVSIRDIPATVLDFVGGGGASLPGRSLARHWSGTEPADDPVTSGLRRVSGQPAWYPASRGDLTAVTFGTHRYIRNWGDGTEELFEYQGDPDEQHDLSKGEARTESLLQFRRLSDASRRPDHR
jgi:arylsulfatase A-like enzyme